MNRVLSQIDSRFCGKRTGPVERKTNDNRSNLRERIFFRALSCSYECVINNISTKAPSCTDPRGWEYRRSLVRVENPRIKRLLVHVTDRGWRNMAYHSIAAFIFIFEFERPESRRPPQAFTHFSQSRDTPDT